MYRTLCVVALLTLQAGWAHCFSWDIVAAAENRLAFYNEGKVTHSVTFTTDVDIRWITYDPFHNRVLFTNNYRSLLSFDIATGKNETLIDFKSHSDLFQCTYDPATGLIFVVRPGCKVYSYLVKPGSYHGVDPNFVIDMGDYCGAPFGDIAVDSCGGYIYWINVVNKSIERTRLNGSGREELLRISDTKYIYPSLTIDPQTQNMYWMEGDVYSSQQSFVSADFNGKHRRTLYEYPGQYINSVILTASNDFIYWTTYYTYKDNNFFSKFPKNLPLGTYVKPKQITYKEVPKSGFRFIAANYAIEEQTQGTPLCNALKRLLLPNYSETNDSDSLNVSTGGSLLRVNETKVSGESRVSGDTCNISVCHNYCLQGNCSVNADGQPKCRCYVGYTGLRCEVNAGLRCEVNACQTYCLHNGVCSLSEQNNPVCQCTAGYQGERCDVPALLIKCSQAVSLLKDILNTDLTSVTEGKGVKSTCASTDD